MKIYSCVSETHVKVWGLTNKAERKLVLSHGGDLRIIGILHTFTSRPYDYCSLARCTELEFLNNLWGLGTRRKRVLVPARLAT
jgi:hypothetical protein